MAHVSGEAGQWVCALHPVSAPSLVVWWKTIELAALSLCFSLFSRLSLCRTICNFELPPPQAAASSSNLDPLFSSCTHTRTVDWESNYSYFCHCCHLDCWRDSFLFRTNYSSKSEDQLNLNWKVSAIEGVASWARTRRVNETNTMLLLLLLFLLLLVQLVPLLLLWQANLTQAHTDTHTHACRPDSQRWLLQSRRLSGDWPPSTTYGSSKLNTRDKSLLTKVHTRTRIVVAKTKLFQNANQLLFSQTA